MEIISVILIGMVVIGLLFMIFGNVNERERAKRFFALGLAGIVAVFLILGGAGLIFSTVGLFAIAILGGIYVILKIFFS